MKVLLINTNRETSPYPTIPIGLAYVASSLVEKMVYLQSGEKPTSYHFLPHPSGFQY